jgi:hypothetical protein
MPTAPDIKHQVADSLRAFASKPLYDAGLGLLNALGYKSELTLKLKGIKDFRETIDQHGRLNDKAAKAADWKNIEFLRQITGDDITASGQAALPLQEKSAFQSGFIKSYVFLAIELKNDHYTRTDLAQINRAVNRVFDMSAMILFKHGEALTLSIINRRLHKRDDSKDVLEKVTLIKDIQTAAPHRAHIEILFDLSIDELRQKHAFSNFDELHAAWRKALDSSELNKRFFREVANWYFWAIDETTFPVPKEIGDKDTYKAQSVIRLITRLIFCWFLREKGLIPEDLFRLRGIQALCRDEDPKESVFYKTILQNLFFATLNQEMDKREFRKDGRNFMAHNLYRYKRFMKDPAVVLQLFSTIPFLNGGLFECLDKSLGTKELPIYVRIDGFSDREDNKLSVPDELFFGDERDVDLNKVFDTRNKVYKVRGLINIFDRYKFTVDENTPIEEEIALDPELLGKVLENLLAAYNPETGATARKQTGSFYTPREIVDYMVDGSLVAYLDSKLDETGAYADDGKRKDLNDRLRHLFAYNEQPHKFSEKEVLFLIAAIDKLKILDPACGSGAFPMGILHKLVFILGKLDPGNERWKARQIAKLDDVVMREELERVFRDNYDNYGRKLYLIENCIYGVDIQPIAVQIAKLRFFISLIVDQKMNDDLPNRGIRPLPNLETKFVAANTLLGIDKPAQGLLRNPEIDKKEAELKLVRERHFAARTPSIKRKWREDDERLRKELSELFKNDGFRPEIAKKLAGWDPYDQNATADYFDLEWMFGITDGYDITIGNPPYVRADSGEQHLALRKAIIDSKQYETLWEKWDLFIPFIEQGYKLLKPGGVTTMIVSDAYCHSKYAQKSQNWFLKNSRVLRLDFFSKIQIFDAAVRNITYLFQKADGSQNIPERRVHEPEFGIVTLLPTDEQRNITYRAFFPEDNSTQQYSQSTALLEEICYISYGLRANADDRYWQGEFTTDDCLSAVRDNKHPKSFVQGKDLVKWTTRSMRYLEWDTNRAPKKFSRPTFIELHEVKEKILAMKNTGEVPKCIYDEGKTLFDSTVIGFVPWSLLTGVVNKSVDKTVKYRYQTQDGDREKRELLSKRFSLKYLLAIMNSTVAKNWLGERRRHNVSIYPDDWKKLPIPDVTSEKQTPIIRLVDEILKVKQADKSADVSTQEAEIDKLVRELYGMVDKG